MLVMTGPQAFLFCQEALRPDEGGGGLAKNNARQVSSSWSRVQFFKSLEVAPLILTSIETGFFGRFV
jgi:hypothetical protein